MFGAEQSSNILLVVVVDYFAVLSLCIFHSQSHPKIQTRIYTMIVVVFFCMRRCCGDSLVSVNITYTTITNENQKAGRSVSTLYVDCSLHTRENRYILLLAWLPRNVLNRNKCTQTLWSFRWIMWTWDIVIATSAKSSQFFFAQFAANF